MSTEQSILEAAEQLFYERSFDGVGVAAIAGLAGVAPSAIYRHFEGKDEILAVLFDHAIDALQRLTAEQHSDPQAELAYLISGTVEFALGHDRLAAIWSREDHALVAPYRRRVQRRQKQYVDRWVTCLDSCYPGWRRPDLIVMVRAVHAILTSDLTRPAVSPRSGVVRELITGAATGALAVLAKPDELPRNM